MAQLNISDKFIEACSPVIDSNYDTCGTITKASIDHMSVTDLNSVFTDGGLFRDLQAWFVHSIEMKSCGTKSYAWYDWIMANADRSMFTEVYKNAIRPGAKAVRGPSLLHPFIMGRQESVVNRDYWKLENGIANSAYTGDQPATGIGTMTQGPLTAAQKALGAAGDRVIRVTQRHGMPLDPAWFLDRQVIYIFTSTGGVTQQGNWKVLAAAVDDSLTYIDVLVTSDGNAASTEPYKTDPGASATKGVIIHGVNNVNDYEKWCNNRINVDPRKMVPFWYQACRNTRCVDSEYLAVFQRLMASGVNEAFRQFGDLDMAERNRQDELAWQKEFVNSFLFQKPISTNQTLTLWENLEAINSVTEVALQPGLGGKLQARRANWIGVKEQLRSCGRVKDLLGNPLALNEFFQINYDIMRARKTSAPGRKVTRLDWHTNAHYRDFFYRGMIAYYKDYYQDTARYVLNFGDTNSIDMTYDVYRVPFPANVEIAVISSEFFDDLLTEYQDAEIQNAGNMMLCLDIGKPGPTGGTIYYAQLMANRKVYTTAQIEELARLDPTFRCTMEITSLTQTLISECGTVVVECPLNSLWMHGISLSAPVLLGSTEEYADLY